MSCCTRIGGRTEPVYPFPSCFLPHRPDDRTDRNPLGKYSAQSRGEDQGAERDRITVWHAAELEGAFTVATLIGRRHHAQRITTHGVAADPELWVSPGHCCAAPTRDAEYNAD